MPLTIRASDIADRILEFMLVVSVNVKATRSFIVTKDEYLNVV